MERGGDGHAGEEGLAERGGLGGEAAGGEVLGSAGDAKGALGAHAATFPISAS